ncbi:hypothetical protein HOP50_03g20540 [Chloropicon primus]|uniref:Uncharacterized protein n=2 Tax=Chloropicon primus TaxID=1764295 RepID=A0A5B8MGF5_9CHLO|nr:hypothetical protein A3770_03p20540 [Chloropicon primus]UPQ98748.1 hypothetical protein HOP50_03g20540 [Chloropicon primus]|eukprot:QDZ19536.1 hypothetical protein A3770_03p20540 [Chloropicon primus]
MATTMRNTANKVFGRKVRAAPAASRGCRVVTQAKIKGEVPVSEKEFRRNLGYTEKDSAGQANIFAVEPQVYLQKDENTALVFGVTAVGLAAAFGLGYTLINNQLSQVDEDLTYLNESGATLSSYKTKFAPPPPPPPVVKAVSEPAPAPVIEEEVPAPAATMATEAAGETAM